MPVKTLDEIYLLKQVCSICSNSDSKNLLSNSVTYSTACLVRLFRIHFIIRIYYDACQKIRDDKEGAQGMNCDWGIICYLACWSD